MKGPERLHLPYHWAFYREFLIALSSRKSTHRGRLPMFWIAKQQRSARDQAQAKLKQKSTRYLVHCEWVVNYEEIHQTISLGMPLWALGKGHWVQ